MLTLTLCIQITSSNTLGGVMWLPQLATRYQNWAVVATPPPTITAPGGGKGGDPPLPHLAPIGCRNPRLPDGGPPASTTSCVIFIGGRNVAQNLAPRSSKMGATRKTGEEDRGGDSDNEVRRGSCPRGPSAKEEHWGAGLCLRNTLASLGTRAIHHSDPHLNPGLLDSGDG